MRGFLLVLVALLCYPNLFAQRQTFVTVKAGNNIMDVLSTTDVLQYPQFTIGRVYLRSGTVAEAKLNYNRLMDEMHFIDLKGDTLALADEKNIRHVVIGMDTFYFDGGYVRLLSESASAKLALKQVWIISNSRQIGAYNSTNHSVGLTSFTSFNESGRLYDLTVNANLVLKKIEQFYLATSNNHFVAASKKNLLQLFPKEEQRLEQYLKETKTDFSKRDDLEKVIQFLAQL
jgi:hypothetical protein